jgi:hypothetical protein
MLGQTRDGYAYGSDTPLDSRDPSGLCGLNPFSGDSCLGAAAHFADKHAGQISAITGTAAIFLAPTPLSIPLAVASAGFGFWAAKNDIGEHKYVSAALDLAGAIPGAGALGALRYAKFLGDAAKATEAAGWAARNIGQLEEILAAGYQLTRRANLWETKAGLLQLYSTWNSWAALNPANNLVLQASAADQGATSSCN